MYRTRHFRWKMLHVFGILTHLGLVVTVALSYLCDLGRTTRPLRWDPSTAADAHPCSYALMAEFRSGFTFDMTTHTLLKACLIVGGLGFAVNVGLLAVLLAVEPNRIMLTEGEQHWHKQIVTFFGCLLNLLLAGAGVGLGVTLSSKAAESRPLIAPLIWVSLQAPLALSVAVCDAVKNYREGLDLLD